MRAQSPPFGLPTRAMVGQGRSIWCCAVDELNRLPDELSRLAAQSHEFINAFGRITPARAHSLGGATQGVFRTAWKGSR